MSADTSIVVLGKHIELNGPYLNVFINDEMYIPVPKSKFPKLYRATDDELMSYKLIDKGRGIHWRELNEDLLVLKLVLDFGLKTKK